ncbi:hypothetical protein HWV62_28354 [Athelia sp. TMB]|nr:hypothetical protein HWV62_28354 [Athelia sp. TMB]
MKPETPSVLFSSDKSMINERTAKLGIQQLGEQDMQAAYSRAGTFLRDQCNALVTQHGWVLMQAPKELLRKLKRNDGSQLVLPLLWVSFLRKAEKNWEKVFCNAQRTFNASRPCVGSSNLSIDSAPPLCNIFYLLQMLQPGMLMIHCFDDDDSQERVITRALPRLSWLQDHEDILKEIFGATRHGNLLHAVQLDKGDSCKITKHALSNKPAPNLAAKASNRLANAATRNRAQKRSSGSVHALPSYLPNRRSRSGVGYAFTAPGYVYGEYDSGPQYGRELDWTMCDGESCDWCGRCAYQLDVDF